MNEKLIVISIFLPILLISFLPTNFAWAAIQQTFCHNQKVIYAQDINGVTPGGDNDTAIINDRDGNRLATVNQIHDDYIVWPQTITVPVLGGDVLHYHHQNNGSDSNHHFITFDLLNSNQGFLQKITFSPNVSNNSLTVHQNGFIRFNQGTLAQEYNALLLCAQTGDLNPPIPIANQPPVWTQTPAQSTIVGQNLSFTVLATDPDNNPLTYGAFNLPFGASFNPTNKTFSWTPVSGQAGVYIIYFRVFDGAVGVDMTVTINVANINNITNQPPVWSQVPNQSIIVGQNSQFIVFASDPENNSLTYSALNLPSGAHFNSANRTFSWTPVSGQAGNYTITFRVTDGVNNVDMSVLISVLNLNNNNNNNQNQTNNPPVWLQVSNQTVTIGQNLQFTVFANDPENNPLFYSAFNLPAGAFFSSATKIFSWVPGVGQSGIYTVTFRVADGANTVDLNVTINVLNNYSQQAPVWSQLPTQYVNTGQTLQFIVSASDFYTNPLTYSVSNLPSGAYFNASNRSFTWTPTGGQNGAYNVVFRVSNGFGSSDMNVAIIVYGAGGPPYNYNNYPNYPASQLSGYQPIVYPTNYIGQTPSFTSPLPTLSAREGQVYTYTAQAVCGGGPVSYRVLGGPNGLTINQNFGVILWVPDFSQGRSEPYPVTIGAGCGGQEASQTFHIAVQDMPNAVGLLIPTTAPAAPTIIYDNQPTTAVAEGLKITDLKMKVSNDDVVVSWTTNKPASSRLVYDITSQINKAGDFSYADATAEDSQLTVNHSVNLNRLENGKTYYLRAVSKIKDEVATSREAAFVKLTAGQVNTLEAAALLGTAGAFLDQSWLLWLVIILLAIWLVKELRDKRVQQKNN